MADIDLKAATPDTSLPSTGFLFGADSQSASAPSVYSVQTVATALLGSTSLTGATVTTSSPVLDLAQTWNASGVTFTGLRYNATDTASASGSLLMDLQVGGSSRFNVNKLGYVKATNRVIINAGASETGIQVDGADDLLLKVVGAFVAKASSTRFVIPSAAAFSFANTSSATDTPDTFLSRRGAANLQLGAADAASPVPQFLTAQGAVGTNIAGAAFTIQGSRSTGNAAGGSIVFQVTPLGGAGSGLNTYETALTIDSTGALNINADRSGNASGAIMATIKNDAGQNGFGLRLAADTFARVSLGLDSGTPFFGFGSGSGARDTFVTRDAANTLAQRNGAAAQAFRVYNTTDGTNLERGFMRWSSNVLQIGTEKAGTGTARALELQTDGTTRLTVATDGAANFVGALTIASGVSATQTLINNIGVRAGAGCSLYWSGRSVMQSPTDGVILLLNQAGSDFGRLQFGGTTSSFPALKRSSTTLQARLADDSAFAPVQGKLTTETAYTAGDPTTTGYLVIYDSNGTAYKVPAVAL